jgi:hypothetical protein
MRGRRFARFARFLLFAIVALLVLSYVVMRLWNWLIPPVFGLHLIGYWQALGLLVLSKILFGGFGRRWGGGWRGMHWRRRMMERWAQMTPEEREKFRAAMQTRCGPGPFAAPTPAPEPKP